VEEQPQILRRCAPQDDSAKKQDQTRGPLRQAQGRLFPFGALRLLRVRMTASVGERFLHDGEMSRVRRGRDLEGGRRAGLGVALGVALFVGVITAAD